MIRANDNLPDELCKPEGFIGELVEYMDRTSEYSLPELFLAASLCLVSVVTGRKVQDYRGTRPNLYCVAVGPTGCGKDHSRQVARQLLRETNLEGPESFTSGSAIATALADVPSLLCQVDEIGLYLKAACNERAPAHLAGVITALISVYTSSKAIWKPTGYADSKRSLVIDQPNLVIHGSTTPGTFFDAMHGDDVASGFIGRLLIFQSPGGGYAPRKDFTQYAVPKSVEDFIQYWVTQECGPGNLNSVSPEPRVIEIATDAKKRIDQHFQDISERRIGEDASDAALWSRTSEKTSKLALLAAISRRSDAIELQDADYAVSVANFLTRRLVAMVRGNVASTAHERSVQKLMRIVEESGPLSMSELSRKTQWLKRRDRLEIIQQQKESGELIDVVRVSKTKPAFGLACSRKSIAGTGWVVLTTEMMEQFKRP